MSGKRSSIWFRQLLTQRLDRKFIEKIHGEIGVLLVEGIRDDGYLDLMEFYVKPELVDEDIYNVSGRILYDIIEKHPFWDGNKRTGFTAATTVLAFANRTIEVPDEDVEAFCLDLASRFEQSEKGEIPPDEGPEIEEVAEWFRGKSRSMPLSYYIALFIGIAIAITISTIIIIIPVSLLEKMLRKISNLFQGA